MAYECRISTRDVSDKLSAGGLRYTLKSDDLQGTTLTKMKRYSAFCKLRDNLLASFPTFANILDSLPPKSLGKYLLMHLA